MAQSRIGVLFHPLFLLWVLTDKSTTRPLGKDGGDKLESKRKRGWMKNLNPLCVPRLLDRTCIRSQNKIENGTSIFNNVGSNSLLLYFAQILPKLDKGILLQA